MLSIRTSIKTVPISFAILLLTLGLPLTNVASASAEECVAPSSSQPGVHWPTGSDASTFIYQCEGPYAGKWTNAYYVYDPATTNRSPLYAPEYSYDCASGKWSKTSWDFWAADSQYHKSRVTSADPGLPTNCPVPDPAPASGNAQASSATTTNSSGPGSSNGSTSNGSSTFNGTNNSNVSLNNTVTSASTSGNAITLGNTSAGNATSGNVMDMTNIVNMLQSSSNALGDDSNLVVFTTDIDGDVNGDLFLDPSMLSQVQPAAANTVNTNLDSDTTINNNSNASINNNINLSAQSGDADVTSNTEGGDATTGNAKVVANIVNMINSAITSGKSFLGVININGNLNGDILLPPDFVDQLIAANVPTVTITAPASNNSTNTNVSDTTNITNTNNQGITNNIHSTAASGDANVSQNTSAGNATSGSATTSITAFNLTGSQVVGKNALLVFVNVMGKWVGLIVNAPAGATSAALGGDLSQNTTVNNDTTINNNTNQKINNDITTTAKSGDANVTRNTKGGNAKSGDAETAINLANIENSNLSLGGWFGILFINVFGSWTGSFGINTSAGDPVAAANAAAASGGTGAAPHAAQVFRFVPNTGGSGSSNDQSYDVTPYYGAGSTTDISDAHQAKALLTGAKISGNKAPAAGSDQQKGGFNTISVLIGTGIVMFIVGDAIYTRRHPERA